MLPLSSQVSAPGACHISAGPCISTQQPRGTRPSITRHHSHQLCPQAGFFDDFLGDAPPPYHSPPPLESVVKRATHSEGPCGIERHGRRVKSESCAATYHSHDDDFLANLAAIKLLSGCTAGPYGQISARPLRCDNGCSCFCALEGFHLQSLSNLISKHPTRPLARPLWVQPTLNSGADGYMSTESTDGVRTYRRYRSSSTTPFTFRERFPSDEFNPLLRSICDALSRDSFPVALPNKRLHTSEVSGKEQPLAAIDAEHPRQDHDSVEEGMVKKTSRGMLGALRGLQHKDRSRRSAAFPSFDSSEMPSQRETPSVVSGLVRSGDAVQLTDTCRSSRPVNAPF